MREYGCFSQTWSQICSQTIYKCVSKFGCTQILMYVRCYYSFKELLASTIEQAEQAELKVFRSVCAKDENLECSTSPIELEWYGTEYSRKFGSLLSYETLSTSDEQLQIKYKAAVGQ